MGSKARRTLGPLARLRRLALALPEAHEVTAWHHATFRVRNKMFAMHTDGGDRHAVWIKATAENQEVMIAMRPDRFFKPPYVGPSGWVGMWLDAGVVWAEVADILEDGWRLTAPKRVARAFDTESRA